MADIELVIKIPEELLSKIDDENYQSVISWYDTTLYCAMKDGKPLLKGHGRIMDVDKIIKKMEEREEQLKDNRSMYETSCVETALDMFGETIIEADKENKE